MGDVDGPSAGSRQSAARGWLASVLPRILSVSRPTTTDPPILFPPPCPPSLSPCSLSAPPSARPRPPSLPSGGEPPRLSTRVRRSPSRFFTPQSADRVLSELSPTPPPPFSSVALQAPGRTPLWPSRTPRLPASTPMFPEDVRRLSLLAPFPIWPAAVPPSRDLARRLHAIDGRPPLRPPAEQGHRPGWRRRGKTRRRHGEADVLSVASESKGARHRGVRRLATGSRCLAQLAACRLLPAALKAGQTDGGGAASKRLHTSAFSPCPIRHED